MAHLLRMEINWIGLFFFSTGRGKIKPKQDFPELVVKTQMGKTIELESKRSSIQLANAILTFFLYFFPACSLPFRSCHFYCFIFFAFSLHVFLLFQFAGNLIRHTLMQSDLFPSNKLAFAWQKKSGFVGIANNNTKFQIANLPSDRNLHPLWFIQTESK